MVVQTLSKRYKLFNAQGSLVFSGVFTLHPASPNRAPTPSQGKLVLAGAPTHEHPQIHVQKLGDYDEPSYVDAFFVPAGSGIPADKVKKWTADFTGVAYSLSDLDFQALMKHAKHLEFAVKKGVSITGSDLDSALAGRSYPLVFVSYAYA